MPRVDQAGVAGGGLRVPGLYRALLARERWHHERYGELRARPPLREGELPVYRRPRHLLDALEAGEPVTVPRWRLGGHSMPRMPDVWRSDRRPTAFAVTSDDSVRPVLGEVGNVLELPS
jgi:hypothetical protein